MNSFSESTSFGIHRNIIGSFKKGRFKITSGFRPTKSDRHSKTGGGKKFDK